MAESNILTDTVTGRDVGKRGNKWKIYKFRAHSELRVVGGGSQAKHAHFTAITLAGMQLKQMQ